LNGYRKSVFASSASLLSPKNSFFDFFFACQTSKNAVQLHEGNSQKRSRSDALCDRVAKETSNGDLIVCVVGFGWIKSEENNKNAT
jgi:hypothetical protein